MKSEADSSSALVLPCILCSYRSIVRSIPALPRELEVFASDHTYQPETTTPRAPSAPPPHLDSPSSRSTLCRSTQTPINLSILVPTPILQANPIQASCNNNEATKQMSDRKRREKSSTPYAWPEDWTLPFSRSPPPNHHTSFLSARTCHIDLSLTLALADDATMLNLSRICYRSGALLRAPQRYRRSVQPMLALLDSQRHLSGGANPNANNNQQQQQSDSQQQRQQQQQQRREQERRQSVASKNKTVAKWFLAVVLGVVGMSYASVPLYRMFCQVTGFGGTTQRKSISVVSSLEPVVDRYVARASDAGERCRWR